MTILDEIFAHKHAEVARQKRTWPRAEVQAAAARAAPALDFVAALRARAARPALIAEVKRASPSRGLLAPDFNPLRLARVYRQNGAAAVSVLTDERYFQGSLDYMRLVRDAHPRLPLLRKDFIFDPYQVYQARAAGADAVLLIVAGLPPDLLRDLHALIRALGMTPLVEVHTHRELQIALTCAPFLVGVNNRDLRDFTVNLETSLKLRESIPAEVCMVAESGIHTAEDVVRLGEAGVDAILVGEALVTAPDVAAKVRELTGERISGGVR